MIGFETELVICFYGVMAGILEFVREQLVHQSNSTALLELINENSGTIVGNGLQGELKLLATVTTPGPEHLTRQALRVNPNQDHIIGR